MRNLWWLRSTGLQKNGTDCRTIYLFLSIALENGTASPLLLPWRIPRMGEPDGSCRLKGHTEWDDRWPTAAATAATKHFFINWTGLFFVEIKIWLSIAADISFAKRKISGISPVDMKIKELEFCGYSQNHFLSIWCWTCKYREMWRFYRLAVPGRSTQLEAMGDENSIQFELQRYTLNGQCTHEHPAGQICRCLFGLNIPAGQVCLPRVALSGLFPESLRCEEVHEQ